MSLKETKESRKPSQLKPHPLNVKIYGKEELDERFLELCRNGISTPLAITRDNVVISGHRRLLAALKLGLESVPVLVQQDLSNPLDVEYMLLLSNEHRVKTTEQRGREYEQYKEIEKRRAAERLKKSQAKPGDRVGSAKAGKNFAQPTEPERFEDFDENEPVEGRAAELAAKQVQMSRPTAEKAAQVVHAIDEAEAKGDTKTAQELRETLNKKSVSAAHRKVAEREPGEDPVEARHKTASIVKDSLDRIVPVHLTAQHALAAELVAAGNKLDEVKRLAEKLSQAPGGEYLHRQEILDACTKAKGLFRDARYYTECPKCQGKVKKNCDRCKANGFVSHGQKGHLSIDEKAWLGVESK